MDVFMIIALINVFSNVVWSRPYVSKGDNQPLSETYVFQNMVQYIFFAQPSTWEQALIICRYYKGTLAIVDSSIKVTFLAEAIANSNMLFNEVWIGGRQTEGIWSWYTTNLAIPDQSEDDFPPWIRKPNRIDKECLAADRIGRRSLLFVDKSCKLKMSFICEKGPSVPSDKPLPTKWVRVGGQMFILYHGRVSWTDALAFCWQQGLRLAHVLDKAACSALAEAMMYSRPDFESMWIGATNQFGNWSWVASGKNLDTATDLEGYPPWRFNRTVRKSNDNCLALDRHNCSHSTFIETRCSRTRDFVCEEYSLKDLDSSNIEYRFTYDHRYMTLYFIDEPWKRASQKCESSGNRLVFLDSMETVHAVVEAMVHTQKELKHIWVGGRVVNKQWTWINNDKKIMNKNSDGYPPWQDYEVEAGLSCLNLDVVNHTNPKMYGIGCYSSQPFVCEIDCSSPGKVKNGAWECTNNETSKRNNCSISCDEHHRIMGSAYMSCDPETGWLGEDTTSMLPKCQNMCGVSSTMLKAISSYDEFTSFLFVAESKVRNSDLSYAAMQLFAGIARAFPLSGARAAGYVNSNLRPVVVFPYEQRDSCAFVRALQAFEVHSREPTPTKDLFDALRDQIKAASLVQRTIIIFVTSEDKQVKANVEFFNKMKDAGHVIFTIFVGAKVQYSVTPLASIGPNHALNSFSLENVEQLTDVAFHVSVDSYTNLKNCTAPLLDPRMNLGLIDLPKWLLYRVTNMTQKDFNDRQRRIKKHKEKQAQRKKRRIRRLG